MSINKRPKVLLIHRAFVINHKGQILAIQRSPNDTWMPNFWEVPGGKVEEQQNLTESLEREVYEECGLMVSPTNRVGYFESTIATSAKYKGHTVVSIIGIAICEKDKVRLSPEHQTFAWLNLKDISQLNLTPQVAKALEILEPEIKKNIRHFKVKTKKNMARILIDKDQTIADFNKELCRLFKLFHPYIDVKQTNLTNFYFRDNFPQKYGPDIAAIHNSQGFVLSLPLIRGARKAIYQMMDQGHQVVICTSPLDKNSYCISETKAWIAKKFPKKIIPVIFAPDKTIVPGDYLIDDKPHITGTNPTPTWKRIIFHQPHNQNLDPQIPRIRSWINWPSVIQ